VRLRWVKSHEKSWCRRSGAKRPESDLPHHMCGNSATEKLWTFQIFCAQLHYKVNLAKMVGRRKSRKTQNCRFNKRVKAAAIRKVRPKTHVTCRVQFLGRISLLWSSPRVKAPFASPLCGFRRSTCRELAPRARTVVSNWKGLI
jgi:hypothetical protein